MRIDRLAGLAAALPLAVACTASGNVVISEIMYNPDSDEGTVPNDVEWVELYNNGLSAVSIAGWALQDEDGVAGLLPPGAMIHPGEAVVLVPGSQSVEDFHTAWGGGYSVFPLSFWNDSDQFSNLANDPSEVNEVLTLVRDDSSIADVVNFDDAAPWPTDQPDGPSIYLLPGVVDVTANDDGSNWARSEAGVNGAIGNRQTADFDGFDTGSPGVVFAKGRVCVADVNGDEQVDVFDVLDLLSAWGNCDEPCPPSCSSDLTGDCAVDVFDLLAVLRNWGCGV